MLPVGQSPAMINLDDELEERQRHRFSGRRVVAYGSQEFSRLAFEAESVVLLGVRVNELVRAIRAQQLWILRTDSWNPACQLECSGGRIFTRELTRSTLERDADLLQILREHGIFYNAEDGPFGSVVIQEQSGAERRWALTAGRAPEEQEPQQEGSSAGGSSRAGPSSAEVSESARSGVEAPSGTGPLVAAGQPSGLELPSQEPVLVQQPAVPDGRFTYSWSFTTNPIYTTLKINGKSILLVRRMETPELNIEVPDHTVVMAGPVRAQRANIQAKRVVVLADLQVSEGLVVKASKALLFAQPVSPAAESVICCAQGPQVAFGGHKRDGLLASGSTILEALNNPGSESARCIVNELGRLAVCWEMLKTGRDWLSMSQVFRSFGIPPNAHKESLVRLPASLRDPSELAEWANRWPVDDGLDVMRDRYDATTLERLQALVCPLSQRLARDPVHPFPTGHPQAKLVYEYSMLRDWLRSQSEGPSLPKCPLSRKRLPPIQEWRRVQGERETVREHLALVEQVLLAQ